MKWDTEWPEPSPAVRARQMTVMSPGTECVVERAGADIKGNEAPLPIDWPNLKSELVAVQLSATAIWFRVLPPVMFQSPGPRLCLHLVTWHDSSYYGPDEKALRETLRRMTEEIHE